MISWTIPENHNDLHEAFERAIKIPIASCKRVGKYSGHWPRPISVKFINNSDITTIIRIEEKTAKRIYTNEEYPKEIQRQRNILQPILRLASNLPEYKGKCKLENNTLIIQGKCSSIEDISQLPENLSPIKATQKQDDATIGYFGQLCLYSNFFHRKFVINNPNFKRSKHYIHYTKAVYFNYTLTARAILECETPQETKQFARTIVNFDHQKWIQNGLEFVRPGIKVKFDQNPLLIKTDSTSKQTKNPSRGHNWQHMGYWCPAYKPQGLG